MRWFFGAPWTPLVELGRDARRTNRRARGLLVLMALVVAGVVLTVHADPPLHWAIVVACLLVWQVAYVATSSLGAEIGRAWRLAGGLSGVRRHIRRAAGTNCRRRHTR